MPYQKGSSPFLYDDVTGDVVGVKDSDGGESFFARYSRQTWSPGMLAMNSDDGQTMANRGSFTAPNWWGYSAAAPSTYVGSLMGYLSPVASPQAGAAVVSTVTANDSAYRGGYIHLGRNGMAGRFRSLSVS